MDWFRMYSEFCSDPKVQSMSEAMQRRLVMLLCLRCSNTLVTLQDDEIAFALRIDDAELAQTKELFMRKGFVDATWEIQNWDKRQFISDSSAARVAKHRAAKKEAEKQDETPCNVTVTPQNRTEQNRTDIKANVISDANDIKPESPSKPDCPHQDIIAIYHEVLPMCPEVRLWTPARQSKLRARWNEDPKRQSLDYWRRFFNYVASCDFLVGKTKEPFFANLEWMVTPSNFTKIIERNYENRGAA